MVPLLKDIGNTQKCENYKNIQLTSYIVENIKDKRIRKETSVTKNPFGVLLKNSIMESLFCERQIVEKYRKKKKNLCVVNTDLEKVHIECQERFFFSGC